MIIQSKVKLSVIFMHLHLQRRFCENWKILLLSDNNCQFHLIGFVANLSKVSYTIDTFQQANPTRKTRAVRERGLFSDVRRLPPDFFPHNCQTSSFRHLLDKFKHCRWWPPKRTDFLFLFPSTAMIDRLNRARGNSCS